MTNIDNGFLIRPAQRDEVESISQLLHDLGYTVFPSELESILSDIQINPALDIFLVTHRDGNPVGLATLHHFPVLRLKGYQVTIEELVVHPQFRGRGIGGSLLNFAREFAKGKGAVRLEVITSRKRESFKRGFYINNSFVDAESVVFRIHL
jgi:N-acetylglutamate synthase-like GNAT family acetyltransferase